MRRFFVLAFLIISSFLLQTTIFQFLDFAGVVPNLLLILTMSFGLMRGRKEGLIIGFFCGLLVDISFGFFIGPYALLYMYLGYFNGYFHRFYYVEDVLLPTLMISVNDVIFNLFIYVFFYLLRNRLDFMFYFKHIILPEMIYTVILTLVLYRLFMMINLWLKDHEEGVSV